MQSTRIFTETSHFAWLVLTQEYDRLADDVEAKAHADARQHTPTRQKRRKLLGF
jgi:hypothetical protein